MSSSRSKRRKKPKPSTLPHPRNSSINEADHKIPSISLSEQAPLTPHAKIICR